MALLPGSAASQTTPLLCLASEAPSGGGFLPWLGLALTVPGRSIAINQLQRRVTNVVFCPGLDEAGSVLALQLSCLCHCC